MQPDQHGTDPDVDRSGPPGDSTEPRPRWPLAAGLGLGVVGAGALAFAFLGGDTPPPAGQGSAPPGEAVVTSSPEPDAAPTTQDPTIEPTTSAPPTTDPAADLDQLELGIGTIAGVTLPAPADEVIPLVEATLGPQFVPPQDDVLYYPDQGDMSGCEVIGLSPGPGDARFTHWELEDSTSLLLRGRTVRGEWMIDTYEVSRDEDGLLSLPLGLELGMPAEEALARMPGAEQGVNTLVADQPPWYSQDDLHVFLGGPPNDSGLAGPATEVRRVQFGPLHCAPLEDQVRLDVNIVGQHEADVLPHLTRVLGEPTSTPVAEDRSCRTDVERYDFEDGGLAVEVATGGDGDRVVDAWTVTQDDDRLIMDLAFWIGMSVDDVLALASTDDPGTEQPDGSAVLTIGQNELVFAPESAGRTLVEIRNPSSLCGP